MNICAIGQANNQMSTIRPTQDQRHVCVVSKGALLKVRQIFAHVGSSSNKLVNEGMIVSRLSKGGGEEPKSKQPRVVKFKHPIMLAKKNMPISTCAIASKTIK